MVVLDSSASINNTILALNNFLMELIVLEVLLVFVGVAWRTIVLNQ